MKNAEQLTEIDPYDAADLLILDLFLDGHDSPTGADAAQSVGLQVWWVDRIDLEEGECAPGRAVLYRDAGVVYVRNELPIDEENEALAHEVAHWLARGRGWPKPQEERWAKAFAFAFARSARCDAA